MGILDGFGTRSGGNDLFATNPTNNKNQGNLYSGLESSFGGLNTQDYAYDRGFFGDTVAALGRSFVHTAGLAAHTLDELGIETGIDEWAKTAEKRYDFLKRDIDEISGEDSWLYSGFKGAAESSIPTLTVFGVGMVAGALAPVAGAAVGIGAGLAVLIGLFGIGTYNQTYRDAMDQGLSEADAKSLGLKIAALEVGTEGVADAVAVGTAGLLSAPMKGLSVNAKASLKSILKMTPKHYAIATGSTVSAEVGTEALNAYLQTSETIKAGLDPGLTPAEAAFASIGPSLWLAGGISLGLQTVNHRRKAAVVDVLTSKTAPAKVKQIASDIVYRGLLQENKQIADNFKEASDYIISKGGKFNINKGFIEQLDSVIAGKKADTAASEVARLRENASRINEEAFTSPLTDETLERAIRGGATGKQVSVDEADIQATPPQPLGYFYDALRGALFSKAQPGSSLFDTDIYSPEEAITGPPEGTSKTASTIEGEISPGAYPGSSLLDFPIEQVGGEGSTQAFDTGANTASEGLDTLPTDFFGKAPPEVAELQRQAPDIIEEELGIEVPSEKEKLTMEERRKLKETFGSLKDLQGKLVEKEKAGQSITKADLHEVAAAEQEIDSILGRTKEEPESIIPELRNWKQSKGINIRSKPEQFVAYEPSGEEGAGGSRVIGEEDSTSYMAELFSEASEKFNKNISGREFDRVVAVLSDSQRYTPPSEVKPLFDKTVSEIRADKNKSDREKDVEVALMKAVTVGDTDAVNDLLSLYRKGHHKAAAVEVGIKIANTLNSVPESTATETVRKRAFKIISNFMKGAPEARELKGGAVDWKKAAANMYYGQHKDTGVDYILYREAVIPGEKGGGWRISRTKEGFDELTKLDEFVVDTSRGDESVRTFVNRFNAQGGHNLFTKKDLDEAGRGVYTAPKAARANTYEESQSGEWFIVPRTKGNWGLMRKEAFFGWEGMSRSERNAAWYRKDGVQSFKKAEIRDIAAKLERSDLKQRDVPQELTAKSPTLEQFREVNEDLYEESSKYKEEREPSEVKMEGSKRLTKDRLFSIEKAQVRTNRERLDDLMTFHHSVAKIFAQGNFGKLELLRNRVLFKVFGYRNPSKAPAKLIDDVNNFVIASAGSVYNRIFARKDIIDGRIDYLEQKRDRIKNEYGRNLNPDEQREISRLPRLRQESRKLGGRLDNLARKGMNLLATRDIDIAHTILKSSTFENQPLLTLPTEVKSELSKATQAELKRKSEQIKKDLETILKDEDKKVNRFKHLESVEDKKLREQYEDGLITKQEYNRQKSKIPIPKRKVVEKFERKVLNKVGPMYKYEGDNFYRTDDGHRIFQKTKGGNWFIEDTKGVEIATAFKSLKQLEKSGVIDKNQEQARTPETATYRAEDGTLQSLTDIQKEQWKLLQEEKKLKAVQQSSNTTSQPFNGWVERDPGSGILYSENGSLIAGYIKPVEDNFGIASGFWGVWSTTGRKPVEKKPAGKFNSALEVMNFINGREATAADIASIRKAAMAEKKLAPLRESVGDNTRDTGNTVSAVIRSLVDNLSEGTVRRWGELGVVDVVQTLDETSGEGYTLTSRGHGNTTVGFYNPHSKQVTLIADRIVRGEELDIFLHEGLHFVLDNDKQFSRTKGEVLNELSLLRRKSKKVSDAYELAEAVNKGASQDIINVEAYSYLIQDKNNRNQSWYRKIVGGIKRFLAKLRIPVSKLGLTEDDLVLMALRRIDKVSTESVDVGDSLNSLQSNNNEASEAIRRGKLNDKDFADFFGNSLVRDKLGVPIVMWSPSSQPTADPATHSATLGVGTNRPDPVDYLGVRLSNEEQVASGGTGQLNGFYVRAENPIRLSRRYVEAGIFGREEAIAKRLRLMEVGGHDSIFVTNDSGRIEDIIVFNQNQIQPAGRKFTAEALQDLRLSTAQEGNSNDNRITSISANVRNQGITRPTGEETPTNKDGKPRSDFIRFAKKENQYQQWIWNDNTEQYNISEISEGEYNLKKEQYRIERVERERSYIQENPQQPVTLEKTKNLLKNIKRGSENLLKSISASVKDLSKPAYARLMHYEHDSHQWQKKLSTKFEEFDGAYNTLDAEDKFLLDQALRNTDTQTRDEILAENDIKDAFILAQEIIDEIENEAINFGLVPYKIKNYFPRVLKPGRVDEYMKSLEVERKAKAEKKSDREIYEEGRDSLASQMDSGISAYIRRPGASKERTIGRVRPDQAQFYENSAKALRSHIFDMVNAIQGRKLIGSSGSGRKKLMRQLDKVVDLIEKLSDTPIQNAERLTQLRSQHQEISMRLQDIDSDLDSSIAAYAEKELGAGSDKATQLADLIRARLKQKGTHGLVGSARDIAYMFTLGSPMSAITQLADIILSVIANNPINTAASIFASIPALYKGNNSLVREHFDFTHSRTDWSDNATAATLDMVLTASGLKSMDIFGKEVFMRAAARKNSAMTKDQFVKQWSNMFFDDVKRTEAAYDALQRKEYGNSDALFVLFNSLSQWQPITLSELPPWYNTAGNLRVFYMLKGFHIKALNGLRNEVVSKWESGNKLGAARQGVYIATLISLAGAGTDELKDFILGRESSFKDNFFDNLTQMTLLNRYSLEKGYHQGRIVSTLLEGHLPPFRFADHALDDIGKFMFDRENYRANMLKDVPIFGRIVHAHTDFGRAAELARQKKDIYDIIKDNTKKKAPLYANGVRDLVSRYNKIASDIGEERLGYKQLRNVRKRESKKLKENA